MSASLPDPSPGDPEIARLSSALAREERISGALREVGVALGTTLDLDDLLELILGRLTDLLEADRSTLYLLDEAQGDLISRVTIGSKVRSIRVKIGHGIAGTVAKTGKPIRVHNAYEDPRFEAEWDLLTGYKTRCMLAAPLKNHLGRTIGVIQVLNKAAGNFTDEDEAILTALSTQAAVAIDNSRLFLSLIQKNRQLLDTKDQLERKVRDLELLFELERATSRTSSLDELILAALSAAARACEARGAALLLAEEDTGNLVEYLLDLDAGGRSLERRAAKHDRGFLNAAMAADGVLNVTAADKDSRWHPAVEGAYPFPVTSVIGICLEGQQAPIGSVAVMTKRGDRAFSSEDESLLHLISANTSTALRLFRASEERERSARLTSIGRLLSQVIHDFKTPLTVISGYVQLMQNCEDPELRRAHASKALRQFDVLQAMQREVLEFARGEQTLFVRRVYLHKFFSDIRSQLSHEMDGRAVDLEMDIDTKVVARFDEARVARAIHNLARNALEAMAQTGGTLRIGAKMDGDELLITVSDSGPGVPEEISGRLFQSFVTAGKKGGTGLGLAIVKKIVEEHGGRVECTSSRNGATFALHFPQPPAKERAAPSIAPPAGNPSSERPLA